MNRHTARETFERVMMELELELELFYVLAGGDSKELESRLLPIRQKKREGNPKDKKTAARRRYEMPLFGPNIKKMKERRDIDGLITALRNDNPQTRVEATEALTDLDEPKALELMVKEFSNPFRFGDKADKIEAITIIRGCPTPESLMAVTLSLDFTGDKLTRICKFQKVKFRKRFNLDLVRPILVDVAQDLDENPVIRWYAVTALAELGDRSDEVVHRLFSILGAMPKLNLDIVEENVRILSYFPNNPDVIATLMKIQKGELFKAVLEVGPRSAAIYALAATGNSSAREHLEYLATHGDKFYRKRAQLALKLFGKANYDEIKANAEKEIID